METNVQQGPSNEARQELLMWEIWQGWGSWGQGDDGPDKPKLKAKVLSRSFKVACLKYQLMEHFEYIAKADMDGTLKTDEWNLTFHYNIETQCLHQCWPFFATKEEAWKSFPRGRQPNVS